MKQDENRFLFHTGALVCISQKGRFTRHQSVQATSAHAGCLVCHGFNHETKIHLSPATFTKFAESLNSSISRYNLLHFSLEQKGGRHQSKAAPWWRFRDERSPNLHSSKFQMLRPTGHLWYHHESVAAEKEGRKAGLICRGESHFRN